MIVKRIKLVNFRGYDRQECEFSSGLNAIVGTNGSGKTNLVESIHYLNLARSWRTSEDRILVRDGQESAYIAAEIVEGPISRTVEVEIGRNKKKISLNGKPVRRLTELSKLINVIVFSPDDVQLFSQSPSERRGFLDVSISKQSPDYLSLISTYNRLLKERNALLKSNAPDMTLLSTITEQMVEISLPIVKYREMYVESLNSAMPDLLAAIKGEAIDAKLVYKPFVKADEKYVERAKKAFENALESDLYHKLTSVGPHREDIGFLLRGKDISDYGSRGENRMAVLALKLSPYKLVDDPDKKPICVLDDVVSELDETRVDNLMGILKGFSQVFVTSTKINIDGATFYDVSHHRATRRK